MKVRLLLICLMILVECLGVAYGQEEATSPHSVVTELSAVLTDGNSESTTLRFKNAYKYSHDKSTFLFNLGAIRSESASQSDVILGIDKKTTDEKYDAELKYEQKITEKFYWFTGTNWTRNRFAGINNRYEISAGVGNIWIDSETTKFATDYGLQYTIEDPVFEPLGYDDQFGSIKLGYTFFRKVGANSHFDQKFDGVTNLEDAEDFRVNLDSSFTTAISTKLALKVGLLLLFDNQPAFIQVNGIPYELESLDKVFSTSLVIAW